MKMITLTCLFCKKSFQRKLKEHNRRVREGHVNHYCSISCSSIHTKTIHKKVLRKCLFCNKEFESSTHKRYKKCCSVKCATKYAQSFFDFKSVSNRTKRAWERGCYKFVKIGPKPKPLIKQVCCVCGKNQFVKSHKLNKTCSRNCFRKLISKLTTINPNCGGETNYKRYLYKNIRMDSSWEVDLAKWMDANKILWNRSRKLMFHWTDENGNKRRYYPDFYLPKYNLYLDPKNKFLQVKDKFKLEQVRKENEINLICGSVESIKQKILMGS